MDITVTTPSAKSLTSMAIERLRGDILDGALQPAERLRIQALTERYGIGATAIREALSRLVADGLVSSEDQRGFCVTPVSREDLLDLTQTRIEAEGSALRLAVQLGDIEWESYVLSAFHRLQRTAAPTTPDLQAAWNVVHRQFHETLLSGCASPWRLRLCRILYDQSERYRSLAIHYTSEKNRDPMHEHRALMEAAMARDGELAVKILSEHFWKTSEIVLKALFDEGSTHQASASGGRRKRTT